MLRWFLGILFVVALAVVVVGERASAPDDRVGPTTALVPVGGRFDAPLHLTSVAGERAVYVVEQGGRIWRVEGERRRLWGDLTDETEAEGERGLLSLAFPPRWRPGRPAYVYYTAADGSQLVAAHATDERGLGRRIRTILRMPDSEPNHNGGELLFSEDGSMWIGTGDGGGAGDRHGRRGNAQDRTSLLGKILRIRPTPSGRRPYLIPADNPGYARGEIWAYGLRNPWRYAVSGEWMIVGDVGQGEREEITMLADRGRGANLGWRAWEGSQRFTDEPARDHRPPSLEHSHDDGWCSIVGGVVPERGEYRGRYLYGDFCEGGIRVAAVGGRRSEPTGLSVESLSSFGTDGRGTPYALSLDGVVYRIADRR